MLLPTSIHDFTSRRSLMLVCCDIPPFLGKDIPMLSFLFCLRGGGGVEEGIEATDTFLGSLESKVSFDERSQQTHLGSSSV